jgi:hypothetical protein
MSTRAFHIADRHLVFWLDLHLGSESNIQSVENLDGTLQRDPKVFIALIPRDLGLMNV